MSAKIYNRSRVSLPLTHVPPLPELPSYTHDTYIQTNCYTMKAYPTCVQGQWRQSLWKFVSVWEYVACI
jgi:hypothetical protein